MTGDRAHARHHAITLVVVDRADRTVDRQLLGVGTDTVAVCIGVGPQTSLQHAVRGGADTRHEVGRREDGLFDFREVVLRVAIELHLADFHQREVTVRPHLGQIERVDVVVTCLGFGHHLQVDGPARTLATLEAGEHVVLVEVRCDLRRLIVGQRLVALVGLEVPLDPDTLALVVPQAQREL